VEAEFALGALDAGVGLADGWLEIADLDFRIHVVALGQLIERLAEDLERLAHFQEADHDAVITIAFFAERDAET
jgi:hypothetical protein